MTTPVRTEGAVNVHDPSRDREGAVTACRRRNDRLLRVRADPHVRVHGWCVCVPEAPPQFPHHLPGEYARSAERLRDNVELPVSLGDDCAGRPWFHAVPWWPRMDTSDLDREEWRAVVAYSRAHIMLIDEAIGGILDALERLGLADSTTLVFSSDHGDIAGAHNRFDKGPCFYEEVWRIPLIVHRPGVPPATQEAFVSILDVGETLFRLIGSGYGPRPLRSSWVLHPRFRHAIVCIRPRSTASRHPPVPRDRRRGRPQQPGREAARTFPA